MKRTEIAGDITVRAALLAVALAFVGAAQAQIKCWKDAAGNRMCGDTPPPGAAVSTVKVQPAPPPAAAGKDAKKGPLTPAEKEQAFRQRQQEAAKAAEKTEKADEQAAKKQQNCANARQNIQMLESGQRIARFNSAGERYFIDDAQRATELTEARKIEQESCGN
ncbi:MAG TPA: DUF4124 domain-containing protein [Burkholderiales bacterium]|nr:DUF4124 domain-containing protein [Burkholderiales bacterium]